MTSVPPGIFGVALAVFVVILAVGIWRFPTSQRTRVAVFLGMLLFSLFFVLCFLLTQRQSEQQFVEIGYYYALNPVQASSSPQNRSDPTLRVGSASGQVDYAVDAQCKSEPCFAGHIDFYFNQRATGANLLTWENSDDLSGSISVLKPRESFLGGIANLLRLGVPVFTDGNTGVELPGSENRLIVQWTPAPQPNQSLPNSIELAELRIELTPPDAPPRIVVENPTPEIVPLPNQRNLAGFRPAGGGLPAIVHLTSSDQAVALRLPDRTGYIPTIKVGKAAPEITVNAFLERPSDQERGSDFILNDGLRRIGNPLGQRFYVGTSSGLVGTVMSRGNAQWTSVAAACLLLWLLPLLFFLPTLLLRKDIQPNPGVYLLLAAVQMLLAVRIVLGARAYFWEPYNRAALETALFASLLIPLMMFIGCHAVGLSEIGRRRDDDGWTKSWWRYLHTSFHPFYYWLFAIVVLILFYAFLGGSPAIVADANASAFQNFRDLRTPLLILLILPPLVWAVGLLLDRRLRGGRENTGTAAGLWREWKSKYGAKRFLRSPLFPVVLLTRQFYWNSPRDNDYIDSGDDPISYSILKTEAVTEEENKKWTTEALRWLLFVSVSAGLLTVVYLLTPRGKLWWQGLVGVTAFVLGVSLRRFSIYARAVNVTISVAAGSLSLLAWVVSGLLVTKMIVRYLGVKSAPEALLPGLPLRTTAFFEILILILAIRVLAAFFHRWRDAETPFRMRGLTIVFVTPMLMLMLSVVASHDTGALLVHGPALLGATVLITGLWPLWKPASGWPAAIWAVGFPVLLLVGYYAVISTTALSYVINDPHGTTNHRVLLREGTDVALSQAETGGQPLLGAIEQNWRMMNYAAEGGWFGRGYGNAPVPGSDKFQSITQDDLVFSVYLLSEEGAVAGLALLALYLTILVIALRMAWETLRREPLRVALAGCLGLMLVFPALYMAAANVNQLIFTGQNLPLLNLRSNSEIFRSAMVLMLLLAALKPFSVVTAEEAAPASPHRSWAELLRPIPALIWQLFHRGGRKLKAARLGDLGYDPWAASAVVASNLLLILILTAAFLFFPVFGMISAANNARAKEELDLKPLKARADEYIRNGQIWFEPVQPGAAAGKCIGGAERNRPVLTPDQTTAYQVCMDSNVKGGAEGDTFYNMVKEWNARKQHRGNGDSAEERYDARQFFQLDLSAIRPVRGNDNQPAASALAVNQTVYHWASPFRPQIRWTGALTEADALVVNSGVLIGANLQLPLRGGAPGEPIFAGTAPGHVRVNIGEAGKHGAERGFAIFEKDGARPIFEIDTVTDALGARLVPVSGDFDLFVNGCRVMVGNDCEKPSSSERGTAPPFRLDDGDVIAYAVPDNTGRRVPRHVFVYSHAQLGSFSHLA